MALPLYIHPCICSPAHPHHPPPPDKPLRIHIQGPLESIQKLLPNTTWLTKDLLYQFPQPAGPQLAKVTSQALYKQEEAYDYDSVVRDEYLAWVMEDRHAKEYDNISI